MATNLRLRPETERALRERSESTGISQQELIREALDRFLGSATASAPSLNSIEDYIARGLMKPATPYREVTKPLKLPDGVRSEDLLRREDRF